jgi:hypothetical protein
MLLWPLPAHPSRKLKAVFPKANLAKGRLRLTEKRGVATAIFSRNKAKKGFNAQTFAIVPAKLAGLPVFEN